MKRMDQNKQRPNSGARRKSHGNQNWPSLLCEVALPNIYLPPTKKNTYIQKRTCGELTERQTNCQKDKQTEKNTIYRIREKAESRVGRQTDRQTDWNNSFLCCHPDKWTGNLTEIIHSSVVTQTSGQANWLRLFIPLLLPRQVDRQTDWNDSLLCCHPNK